MQAKWVKLDLKVDLLSRDGQVKIDEIFIDTTPQSQGRSNTFSAIFYSSSNDIPYRLQI